MYLCICPDEDLLDNHSIPPLIDIFSDDEDGEDGEDG